MNDPRAQEGVEHLQKAAHELIEAARAFLDVAENRIEDREFVTDAAGALADVLSLVGRRPGEARPDGSGVPVAEDDLETTTADDGHRTDTSSTVGRGGGGVDSPVTPRPSRVRRIEVD